MMIGIQKGEKFLLKERLHEQYSCIFVCLDERKVYVESSLLKEITIPVFDGFEKNLQSYYNLLNNDINYNVINHASKPQINQKKKKLRYYYQFEERQAGFKILEMFKNILFDKIIRYIPPQPLFTAQRVKKFIYVYPINFLFKGIKLY